MDSADNPIWSAEYSGARLGLARWRDVPGLIGFTLVCIFAAFAGWGMIQSDHWLFLVFGWPCFSAGIAGLSLGAIALFVTSKKDATESYHLFDDRLLIQIGDTHTYLAPGNVISVFPDVSRSVSDIVIDPCEGERITLKHIENPELVSSQIIAILGGHGQGAGRT